MLLIRMDCWANSGKKIKMLGFPVLKSTKSELSSNSRIQRAGVDNKLAWARSIKSDLISLLKYEINFFQSPNRYNVEFM